MTAAGSHGLLLPVFCFSSFLFPSYLTQVITATPRQLESLIRISEGLARMRFSETVWPSTSSWMLDGGSRPGLS